MEPTGLPVESSQVTVAKKHKLQNALLIGATLSISFLSLVATLTILALGIETRRRNQERYKIEQRLRRAALCGPVVCGGKEADDPLCCAFYDEKTDQCVRGSINERGECVAAADDTGNSRISIHALPTSSAPNGNLKVKSAPTDQGFESSRTWQFF